MLDGMEHVRALHPSNYADVGLVAAACAGVTIIGVCLAPIATFVLMLSAFGLPHVIYELRYCDARFSARTAPRLLAIIGLLLALIALGRVGNGTHVIPSSLFVPLELGLGAVLALVAAWHMRAHRWLGASLGLGLALGATLFPLETFLAWAWLHNLTPVGFVAEITEGEERRYWMMVLFLPFVVLPGLVATGVFHEAVAALVHLPEWQAASAFGAGDTPLLSFLPPQSYDLNLFSAAVVAQAMHYVAVIVLLPRLLQARGGSAPAQTIVRWPDWRSFAVIVAVTSAVAFLVYAASYRDARAAYAVAAAIHAWVELPVLLLALGQGFRSAHR